MAQIQTLVDLLETSARRHDTFSLFGTKVGNQFQWITYGEFAKEVAHVRHGLEELRIAPGDRVAIIADNSRRWAELCYATAGRRGVFVPMYTCQNQQDWKHILKDSGARLCVVGSRSIFAAISSMRESLPQLEHLATLDETDQTLPRLPRTEGTLAPLLPRPDEPAGLIYTSGTTATPKGVILSHRNITSNVVAGTSIFPLGPSDRSLSFLPWAHAFGQTVDLHAMLHLGMSIAINDHVSSLLDNLPLVRPTVLVAVPRVFGRICDMVMRQISERPRPIQLLFQRGLAAQKKRSQTEPLSISERLALSTCERVIFSKIRERFGGRLSLAISGSAALLREVAEFVSALGIQIYEGYGLTESAPIVSANAPAARRFGTVGRPLPGVDVSIDQTLGEEPGSGEIVVRGPNVMRGYYQAPEQTALVLSGDGSLRTGDMGYLDRDGYLVVTGRLKEQYKLENGKYVAPAPLEERLKRSPFITNCMVCGANRPENAVLVVPNLPAIVEHFRGTSRGDQPPSAEDIHALLAGEIAEHAREFRSFERPRRILVISEDFTIENGLLTPSQKTRRSAVLERYQGQIDALYQDAQTGSLSSYPPKHAHKGSC